jgi:hypothetical protein
MCGHGELFARGIDSTTFAEEVIGNFRRGKHDLRSASDTDLVQWTVGLGPDGEL